jgi:hypothetical protein
MLVAARVILEGCQTGRYHNVTGFDWVDESLGTVLAAASVLLDLVPSRRDSVPARRAPAGPWPIVLARIRLERYETR